MKIDKYYQILKQQWESDKTRARFFNWIFLRLRKFFRIGFSEDLSNRDKIIDLLIVTASKDFEMLDLYLEALRKNITHKINKYLLFRQILKIFLTFVQNTT